MVDVACLLRLLSTVTKVYFPVLSCVLGGRCEYPVGPKPAQPWIRQDNQWINVVGAMAKYMDTRVLTIYNR